MQAIKYLSLYVDKNALRRVNYAALDVEELGSVYESLLEFHPQVRVSQGIYEFALVYGSDRKTTGSFYTPPQLVQQLIKTALEPVIEEKLYGDQVNFKIIPTPNIEQLQNPNFSVTPRHYVAESEVNQRLAGKWDKEWLLCFRGITLSVNERTAIFSILPKVAVANSAPIILPDVKNPKLINCLLANSNTLTFDFIARQKVGGNNMNFFIVKQLPILSPESYTQENIDFIAPRVLELVYTAWDMQPFALDMGYDGEPFIWNSNRRAILRAELDAYYAKLYGLTRDELRYILDPADVYGADFPSETFRVLKNNEIKQFGEYRTQRLVLESWDKMFGRK